VNGDAVSSLLWALYAFLTSPFHFNTTLQVAGEHWPPPNTSATLINVCMKNTKIISYA
jgi:hypothetical protein